MSAIRSFLAWPAGASLAYLVSAASLLGGATLVLAPSTLDDGRLAARCALLGTVQLYIGLVAALATLVCRWRPGNGDAVALLVLLALFLPLANAGLVTIATHQPLIALGVGVVGFALAASCLMVVQRRVTGPWGPAMVLPLTLVQAWHAVAPGVLGLVYQVGSAPRPLFRAWLPGWWVTVACALLLGIAAWRARPAEDGRPLVAGAGLRWALALMAVVAGGLHQFLLTYALDLGVTAWDLSALAVALLLLSDVLLCRWHLATPGGMAVIATAIAMILVFGADCGNYMSGPDGPRALAGIICYQPFMLAIGGMALGLIAWRRHSIDTLVAGTIWLLGALLTWNVIDGWLNLRACGIAIFVIATLLVALAPRHPLLWMLVVVMCLATVHQSLVPALATTVAVVVRALRTRSHLTGLTAMVPLGAHGWMWICTVFTVLGGWLAVLAAFVLLSAGAWVSWRRTRAGDPGFPAPSAP